jgi:formylglycine-generating enzyme required for sulfatase activity
LDRNRSADVWEKSIMEAKISRTWLLLTVLILILAAANPSFAECSLGDRVSLAKSGYSKPEIEKLCTSQEKNKNTLRRKNKNMNKKSGMVFRDCAECPAMVVVPAGSFQMGDLNNGGAKDEKPVHQVIIGKPFAVGKYEVTQAEWHLVMGDNLSRFRKNSNPVENVSWDDAKNFTRKLSVMTGKKYRLLTEAEWEYAARAGSTTLYHWGNNFSKHYAAVNRLSTEAAGSYAANAFGLHDMHGNVWEWVEDCDSNNYKQAPNDGSAYLKSDCGVRGLRGGSWYDGPDHMRSANRDEIIVRKRSHSIGFRIARDLLH